ncbi:MAG: NAAT family transporter [Cytophagales bacterium]|nr:MAG: NAAT family transporter [Cytophagales bacterium]
MTNEITNLVLLAFTSFFTLLNPLGVMPVFMTMTASLNHQQRTNTARKAVIVAFFTIVAFAYSGQLLFNFFGISVNGFRMVGGILFFIMGYDMLQARLVSMKISAEDIREYVDDISITPLAIPMLCGPGAITNAIVLMEDANNIPLQIALIATILVVCAITFVILWSSSTIIRLLGDTGNKIMMRLMGLIVMVIAIEFFFSGLKPILQEIIHKKP